MVDISSPHFVVVKVVLCSEIERLTHQYRTPRTLRAYSDFFIVVLPILYGPYFFAASVDYTTGLEFVMPLLFAFILVGLDNFQDHLENPFDQIGVDDIAINAEKFIERLEN